MKRISLTYILFTALFFISCSDFLKETNYSGLSDDPFYDSEVGIEALVNSCYTPSRLWYGKEGGASMTELGTDLFLKGGDCKHPQYSLYDLNLNSQDLLVQVYWAKFYEAVNYCNTALARLKDAPLKDDIRKRRIGEVSFLRAFYYWHLTEIWGEIHLTTTPSEGVQTESYKSSTEKVYEQIFSDLEDAINNLQGYVAQEGGRITLPAAEAFKARMLLTRGQYAEAATFAEKVISDYGFQLFDKYADVWEMANCEGSTNSEVIWYVNYSSDLLLNKDIAEEDYSANSTLYANANCFYTDGGNNLHLMFCYRYDLLKAGVGIDLNGIGYQRYATSRHLLELYDENIDQRYDGTFREVIYSNGDSDNSYTSQLGDTAIYFTKKSMPKAFADRVRTKYCFKDIDSLYYEDGRLKDNRWFVEMHKHADHTRAAAFERASRRDAFVIRLSEMYLIAAEAEMMRNNMPMAVKYMNDLRTKRAYPGYEDAMKISANDMNIDFILDERARELVGEQLRWFDLKRTGKLVEYVKKWNPDARNNIKDYHVLRPIPQVQLDAISNKTDFLQNEGYK